MSQDNKQEKLDLVLWGATGFTGALCAKYLARNAFENGRASQLKWGIAGRDTKKLEQIKQSLLKINSQLSNITLIAADSGDVSSIEKMVSQTRVIISTVGPYTLYGTPLVDACVKYGVDYADITGETIWVKSIIDKHHENAVEKKVIICPMCGYDSIPSDLGTFFVTDYIKRKYQGVSIDIARAYQFAKADASGGTFATIMITANEISKNKKVAKLLAQPHLLDPQPPSVVPPEEKDILFIKYDPFGKTWIAPFPMGTVNTRVVRRTNALLLQEGEEYAYGPKFTYNEYAMKPSIFKAFLLWAGLAFLFLMISFSFTRKLLQKFIPKPGEGPSEEKRAKHKFVTKIVARTVPIPSSRKPIRVEGTVSGGDPGYDETAKMLCEAGLTLALQRDSLPRKGGVLTPATAFGNVLIQNLNNAGILFKIQKEE